MAYVPTPYGEKPGLNPPPPGVWAPLNPPPPGVWAPGPSTPQPGTGPVMNPHVPFLMALPPPQDGLMVIIQGYVPPTATRFNVNLSVGAGYAEQVPVALHVNPRFEGTNQVIRNSFQGNWGPEERAGPFPFIQGHTFEMILLMTTAGYKVAINGQHFCEFGHRIVMQNVTHVVVEGDVALQSVRAQPPAQPTYQPPLMGIPPPYNPPVFTSPQPVIPAPPVRRYDLPVPHQVAIFNGLHPGRVIQISGMPKSKADKFSIDLCYHDTPDRDVAFHFNPRFRKRELVCNTKAGKTWGKEERLVYTLFHPEQHFDLVIVTDANGYIVNLNGQTIHIYKHRLKNLRSVRYLLIAGDVLLSEVKIQ